jgi:hypothetical protein
LGGEVRRPKVLLCYNYQNGVTNEEDIIFATKLKLFSTRTISLFETIRFVKTIDVESWILMGRLILQSKILEYRAQKRRQLIIDMSHK